MGHFESECEPGVIDQHVNLTEPFGQPVYGCLNLVPIAHIETETVHLIFAEMIDQFVEPLLSPARDNSVPASGHEKLSAGSAES
jgi:hypothetical protein